MILSALTLHKEEVQELQDEFSLFLFQSMVLGDGASEGRSETLQNSEKKEHRTRWGSMRTQRSLY